MTDDAVKVQVGNPAMIHSFMDLTFACVEENALLTPSTPKILSEVWASLNHDHGIVGVIEGDAGTLEAGIVLRVDTTPYSEDLVLCERFIFVRPEHRAAKGGRASRLCEFAKQIADQLEMPLLIGILSTERAAGKVRLYERHFGTPAGAYWLYGAKTGKKQAQAAE
jgi:hypothetical protein